jgi:hypothetical protein
MVQRLTYRKWHSYATKSNQTRVIKTPGDIPLPVASDFLAAIPVFPSVNYVLNFTSRSWCRRATCVPVHQQVGERAEMPSHRQEDPGGKPLHAIPFETAQRLLLNRSTLLRMCIVFAVTKCA